MSPAGERFLACWEPEGAGPAQLAARVEAAADHVERMRFISTSLPMQFNRALAQVVASWAGPSKDSHYNRAIAQEEAAADRTLEAWVHVQPSLEAVCGAAAVPRSLLPALSRLWGARAGPASL